MMAEGEDRSRARAERCLRGPGWAFFVGVSVVALCLVGMGLHPSFYYMTGFFLLFMAWGALMVVILLRAAMRDWVVRRHDPSTLKSKGAYRRWLWLFSLVISVTVLLMFHVPLRIGFLTARPGLAPWVNEDALDQSPWLTEDLRVGLYVVSASMTNQRRRVDKGERVVIILADDHESGFIYSPAGIDDLPYNAGRKGHLFGDWYWMKED